MNLTKKIGPLPVWAWGVAFGVIGYILYLRMGPGASSGQASPTASVLDPNAIDPNTGLTYGQEEAAALGGNAAGSGGGFGGASSPSESGLTLSQELSDLESILGLLASAQQLAGPTVTPPDASQTATEAAASPPVQNAHPPASPASSHTSPHQTKPAAPKTWVQAAKGRPACDARQAAPAQQAPEAEAEQLIGVRQACAAAEETAAEETAAEEEAAAEEQGQVVGG